MMPPGPGLVLGQRLSTALAGLFAVLAIAGNGCRISSPVNDNDSKKGHSPVNTSLKRLFKTSAHSFSGSKLTSISLMQGLI